MGGDIDMTRELRAKPDWLKPLFPWEQHAITVNGRTMAYIDEGEPSGRPVLLPWADGDPITREGESVLRGIFSNCAPPLTIPGAGHFIQEDAGEEVAEHIRNWMALTLGK